MSPRPEGLDNTIRLYALAYARRGWPGSCCCEAEHELLLDGLARDARNDPDLAPLLDAPPRKGAKILLTADRGPSGIEDIDDRLHSRFEMGLVVEVHPDSLPAGAGDLNLQEAPDEFIQDDDLWAGFMRPKVADTVLPPLEEFETGDRAGLMVMGVVPEQEAPAPAESEASVSKWRPSKENVVWDWPVIEDRIVEEEA